MAHFRGTVIGRGETLSSRLGTKDSGLTVEAQSWQGKIVTHIWYDGQSGRDMFEVRRESHGMSGGETVVIRRGFLDTGESV